MDDIKTLFLMQLKEKLNLEFLRDRRQRIFKLVVSVVELAAVTVLAYFIMWICRYLNLFSPLNYLPVTVIAVVFFALFIFSVASCTFSLSKDLFYSKDNAVLMTYPISSNKIFISKVMVYFIEELKRTLFFLVPVFYAYAILCGTTFAAYLWIPVMLFIFTGLEVLLSALLALPIYYLLRFFNAYSSLKYVFLFALLAVIITAAILLINSIPEDINIIKSWATISTYLRSFLSWFSEKFYPFYAFAIFLCGRYSDFSITYFTGYSYGVFLAMIAIIAVLLAADIAIYHFFYTKITTRQFEYNKKIVTRPRKNVQQRGFISSCCYETKRNLRYNGELASTVAVIILAPLTVLLLNSIYAAIGTRLIGKYMTLAFNVLIVLLFATSANVNAASVYSRYGDGFAMNKALPNKPLSALLPPLCLNFLKALLIVVPSSAIFLYMAGMEYAYSLLIIFTELFVAFGHILWAAEIDFLNPNPEVFKISGSAGINPNEFKSIMLSFILSLAAMGIVIFFLLDASTHVYVRIFMFAVVFLAYRIFAFWFKAKTLYNDEVIK